MRKFILLGFFILFSLSLQSCGKKSSHDSTTIKTIDALGGGYTTCSNSISGYCSVVILELYGYPRNTYICPVSNRFMSTGRKAYLKRLFNPHLNQWFIDCDYRKNLI